MSLVGVGRIAGDAMSGRLDNLIGVGFSGKVFFFVGLIGSLNLMLLVFNLIPLLPFDGGQAAGAMWEGAKRGWARLRGLPDPGFVDVAKALPVTYAVSILLIVVTVVFSYADIVNQVHITG
jgi:Zn-dependent protease